MAGGQEETGGGGLHIIPCMKGLIKIQPRSTNTWILHPVKYLFESFSIESPNRNLNLMYIIPAPSAAFGPFTLWPCPQWKALIDSSVLALTSECNHWRATLCYRKWRNPLQGLRRISGEDDPEVFLILDVWCGWNTFSWLISMGFSFNVAKYTFLRIPMGSWDFSLTQKCWPNW